MSTWQYRAADAAVLLVLVLQIFVPTVAKAQAGNVVLWNKIGSDAEVTSSEIGPNGRITVGRVPIAYTPVQFDNGLHTYGWEGNPQTAVSFDFPPNPWGDKGTIAMWVRPDHSSSDAIYAKWIDINPIYPLVQELKPAIYWSRGMVYQICQGNRLCQTINMGLNHPLIRFSAGEVIHVALAWDLSGINRTSDIVRGYLNGKQVAARSTFNWPRGVSMNGPRIGNADAPQSAAIDNLVVWDYAKTDFSDRFIESPIASCEGILPVLSALIGSKTGTQEARTWTVTLSNKSYCPGQGAQIDSLKLTQTYGVACTPVITNPASFPLKLGDIAAHGKASGPVIINFSACPSTARFTVKITYSANDGAVKGSKTLNNQYR